MLGIYSLIWTICHRLMWFYRNALLFYIIFVKMHGESLVIWRYGYFDSKQNGAAGRGIVGDGVIFLLLLKEIQLQLSHKASQQVLLQYVSHMAETDKVSLVFWSTVSQNLRLHGAAWTIYFTLCQLSTLRSQNSGLVLEVLVKLMVLENSSWEFPQVGVRLIESIKTTSMEDVSTRVLEKIKNI